MLREHDFRLIRRRRGHLLGAPLQRFVHFAHAVDRVFQNTEGQAPNENAGECFALNEACSVAYRLKNKPMLAVEETRKPYVAFPSQLPLGPKHQNARMKHHGVRPRALGEFDHVAFAELSVQA